MTSYRLRCPYAIASTARDHSPGEEFYAGPKISGCDVLPIESKCRFRIGTSPVVPTPGRTDICVRSKGTVVGVL
ncbi:hypothetical protein Taro_031800 [Colocasia esculenta]|uniref:Uncharacterized protein n=1 Tax=Colocasia esculenta TaxID=4460 RepID=A0A843VJP9_COLES|nr:hypothetical protein [Colocasia esculenta]